MRGLVLFGFALSMALASVAAPTVTNTVSGVASFSASTNAPVAKVSRQQCEAVTKSGNRCKRNAAPGEKFCRQHFKIANRKSGGSAAVH